MLRKWVETRHIWIPPYAEQRINEVKKGYADAVQEIADEFVASYGEDSKRGVTLLEKAAEELRISPAEEIVGTLDSVAEIIEDVRTEFNSISTASEDRMLMFLVEILRMHRANTIHSLDAIHQNWLNDPQH